MVQSALESRVVSAEKRYSAWQAPYLAFCSKAFYADVATSWSGTGIWYMCLLSTIVWAVTVVCTAVIPCQRLMNNPALTGLLQQVPKVTYAGGKLSINRPCPYKIADGQGVSWLVFKTDVEGVPEITPEDPPIVVGKDLVLITASNNSAPQKLELAALKALDHFEFEGSATLSAIKTVLTWYPLAVFAFGLPVAIGSHLLQMLIYGLAVMLLAHFWKKRRINITTGLRLGAMTITPNVLLSGLFSSLCVFLLPFKLIDMFVDYAPINNYAFHHIFAIASIILAIAYAVLAVHSIELAEEAVEEKLPPE